MVKIEVLGSGCANCQRLETMAKAAVAALGLEAEVEHVADMREIVSRGVMATPALAVNGKVVLKGRVPAEKELQAAIAAALQE